MDKHKELLKLLNHIINPRTPYINNYNAILDLGRIFGYYDSIKHLINLNISEDLFDIFNDIYCHWYNRCEILNFEDAKKLILLRETL